MRVIPPITGPVRFTVPSSKVEEFFLSLKLYPVRRRFTQHTIWIIGPGIGEEGGRKGGRDGGDRRKKEEGGRGGGMIEE